MNGHLHMKMTAGFLSALIALGLAGCSGGSTDLIPAPGALAPLASAPLDESRDYPNINVAPGQPEGEVLNPEQQTAAGEALRGRADAAQAQAPDPARMDAAAREIAARQAEVERRHRADRAVLCDNPDGGEVPPSCRQ